MWSLLVVATFLISAEACDLINADNTMESLIGLAIILLIGGFWFTQTVKGVQVCYEIIKAYLE